jgi:hypothetical protein
MQARVIRVAAVFRSHAVQISYYDVHPELYGVLVCSISHISLFAFVFRLLLLLLLSLLLFLLLLYLFYYYYFGCQVVLLCGLITAEELRELKDVCS